ncbi:MAG: S1 RNA-binding domain-containing protein [Planctomycetaceae bacterium]|nr:S1 RNA-binding domain-containing protein [Planctomycetaceae bacterium]
MFLDLGFRSQGILPLKQFEGKEVPPVGTELTVVVHKVSPEEGLIHVSLPSGRQKVQGNWDAVQVGLVVDCMVTKTNKGGLEVNVGSLRGFMPSGQVALHFIENLESLVGQKLTVKILEANKAKKNLIVSRRALLIEERAEAEQKILATLEVGQTLDGIVKTIKDYGAFVDLGGVDGFVHIGQMSWQHIKHPKEVLGEGQAVQVKVISISEDKKKIGLSVKQLSTSPWENAASKYGVGEKVTGTVTRLTDFGAFVQLEPGVEGMVHISELDHKRVARVADVVAVGQELELQVRDVDPIKRRIGLSLKAFKTRPEAPPPPEEAPEEPAAPPPKRKTPLKGGREREEPRRGGMFGNPSDFK